jgi:hypothetical protein
MTPGLSESTSTPNRARSQTGDEVESRITGWGARALGRRDARPRMVDAEALRLWGQVIERAPKRPSGRPGKRKSPCRESHKSASHQQDHENTAG